MKTTKRLVLLLTALAASIVCRGAEELNLFAWSEYVPAKVIKNFTKETGIKVNYETFASGEEMLAKLLAGGTSYDIIQPCDYIIEGLIKNNKIVPLDYSKIPNFKNILPEFKNMAYDPDQKFTVPYMVGSVGIIVNTEKVKEPVTSYADLFSGKYKNRIVLLDDARELYVAALYTLGKDLNDITPENIAAANPILKKWFSQVRVFDSDSPKTALFNGDVSVGLIWSGEAAILWRTEKRFEGKKYKVTPLKDKKYQYVLPKEGAHYFVDILAIPEGAKNINAAHKFIDYILRPDVSKMISDEFPYTNPNGEARKLLSPEDLLNPASYPKINLKPDLFRHLGDERDTLLDKGYTDLKNAN